jgi:hypothetical protein
MPQIQRIPDHSGRGSVGHAEHTAEFSGGETADGWGAVPAQPDRVFGAGQPTLGDRLTGMKIGPVRRNLQPADFGGDQGVFVALRGGEAAGHIQFHQIIFEHTFNIWLSADTHRRLRTRHNQRTTRRRSGQHVNHCPQPIAATRRYGEGATLQELTRQGSASARVLATPARPRRQRRRSAPGPPCRRASPAVARHVPRSHRGHNSPTSRPR